MRNSKRNHVGDVIRVFGLLALLLSMMATIGTMPTAAEDGFSVTGIVNSCDDSTFTLYLANTTGNGGDVDVTFANSSDSTSWSSGEQFAADDEQVSIYRWNFGDKPFDHVMIDARLWTGSAYVTYAYESFVGNCDVMFTPDLIEVIYPIEVTINALTYECKTDSIQVHVDYSAQEPFRMRIVYSAVDIESGTAAKAWAFDDEVEASGTVDTSIVRWEGTRYPDVAVQVGRSTSNMNYVTRVPIDCESPVDPEPIPFDIINPNLACDGTATFSVTGDYEPGKIVYADLINGADHVDSSSVTLQADVSDYTLAFDPSSWNLDKTVRVRLAWGPELFVDVPIPDGTCNAPTVTVTPTVPATEIPVVTETPAIPETPAITETPTATAPSAGSIVTITLLLPNQDSLEGAPWSLYAELASLQAMAPYATGVVGPNNIIVIHDVPDGTYRLVISPEGREALSFDLTVAVGANGTQDIVLDLAESTATATATPDEKESEVTGLPSTGAGTSTAPLWLGLAAVSAMVIAVVGTVGFRKHQHR